MTCNLYKFTKSLMLYFNKNKFNTMLIFLIAIGFLTYYGILAKHQITLKYILFHLLLRLPAYCLWTSSFIFISGAFSFSYIDS